MIRTTKPLPNNLYVMKYSIGVGRYIVMIHIDNSGNTAVLWFQRHSSGFGLHIERHGRFEGCDSNHSHWADGRCEFTLAAHVPGFVAKDLGDDEAWDIACRTLGRLECLKFLL